jgi:phospholipid/cholesterol/gamma-HCH transport system permease protein
MTSQVVHAVLKPVGERFLNVSGSVGAALLLLLQTIKLIFTGPFEWRETFRQMKKIGIESLPIVLFTALFAGMIMILQSAGLSSKFNMRHLMGWGAGYAILREVGPVLIGLMFSGRVGANITAELGTMKVTEQIDGLRALAIDPIRFLVVPRFVAIVVMLTSLLVIGNVVAIGGAVVSADALMGVDPAQFFASFFKLIRLVDLFNGLFKIVMFATLIATASCSLGLGVTQGARDVGRAVNTTVVVCAIGILLLDYLITVTLK